VKNLEKKPDVYNKINCSSIFETLSKQEFNDVSLKLHSLIPYDAVIVYWNVLLTREHHTLYPQYWVHTPEEMKEDLGFLYRRSFSNIKI
jgi:hypothetical protein